MPQGHQPEVDRRESVAVVRCGSYERAEVAGAASRALGLLGGMGRFVSAGRTAFLKPNLLRPARRARRVLTDGEVVRAVAELALEAGARVVVGDSPGLGSARRVMRGSGIAEAIEGLAVETVEPADSRPAGSAAFPALELSGEMLDADLVVNLPKLKTHVQVELTAAVKNLFGAVVGKRKAQWHLRCGTDRAAFARLLVECCRTVAPALTVADGVVAMQGQGPGSGEPHPLGVIVAGTHPVAVDLAFMEMIGFDPRESPVHAAAARAGYGPASLAEVELLGDEPDAVRAPGFRRANVSFTMFPGLIGRAMRRLFVPWPAVVGSRCVRCGRCAEVCAAGAVTVEAPSEGQGPPARIDYRRCIRCFCCHEICPERAVALRTPVLARLLGWGARGK